MQRAHLNLRPVLIFPVLSADVRDPEECAQVLRGVASSPTCPAQYGLTLLSVVRHLSRLCLHGSRNQLSPRILAENFSPLLFRQPAGSVRTSDGVQRKTLPVPSDLTGSLFSPPGPSPLRILWFRSWRF